jgi:DNA helicase II / ATP-dependent DNA helicase PcrA
VIENSSPLLIIAGASSGKTRVIASKIAYLIKKGTKPENIIAITFTQKAAEEMIIRTAEIVEEIYDLKISTFHSFCNEFLQEHLLDTRLDSNFKIIAETAQLVFYARNINTFGLEYIDFSENSTILAEEAKKFISRCKDEFISIDDLQNYVNKKESQALSDDELEDINKLKDMIKIFISYENYKKKNNIVDFGDMLIIVYQILKNKKSILKEYQQRYQYILVDEFQDTNYIQLQIASSDNSDDGLLL